MIRVQCLVNRSRENVSVLEACLLEAGKQGNLRFFARAAYPDISEVQTYYEV